MEMKYCLGLDLSKKDFKACLVSVDDQQETKVKASRTFLNRPSGFEQLWKWMEQKRKKSLPFDVVIEATGVYHENLSWYLHQKSEVNISIVLPNRSKAYMSSLGHKSKNDKVDAKGLAVMGATQKLDRWHPVSKNIYSLRAMTRHLEDLQKIRNGLLNQLEQNKHAMYSTPLVEKSLKATLKAIDKQVATSKEKIISTLHKDEVLRRKTKAMTSIKGVSDLTAAVVIAETNGFALIKNLSQLTSYAGYDVKENQSGQKTGKTKITKKGNAHIRRAMHLPAFNVVRYNVKPFRRFYDRLFNRSGIKMKAYTAVQSELLRMMYTLWKTESVFDEDFQNSTLSGDQEVKLPLPVISDGNEKKIAPVPTGATLGEHPSDQSAEVPLPGS